MEYFWRSLLVKLETSELFRICSDVFCVFSLLCVLLEPALWFTRTVVHIHTLAETGQCRATSARPCLARLSTR